MKNSPTGEIHFFHIPKTAGTSLSSLIRNAYPPAARIPAHTVLELTAMDPGMVPAYRCYTGHFFSLLEPLAGRALPTVTVLRDPFEQTVSLIRHCQRIDRIGGVIVPLYARALEQAWKHFPFLGKTIEQRWTPVVMNNFQTRVLGSDILHPGRLKPDYYGITYPFLEPGFSSPDADMDELFEKAKARLDKMAVVGTVERLPETISLIFEVIGVPVPQHIPHLNAGKKLVHTHRQSGKTNPELASLIERENMYDRALHQYASSLLERKLTHRLQNQLSTVP
jgi:hypothetical protein